MKVDILGIKIDDVTMEEALTQAAKWIWHSGKYYIVTPNPEFIVAAQKDAAFKKILNEADLAIPDGAGLRFSGQVNNTFSGTDFMEALCKLAAEKGFVVSFLGGRDGIAKSAAECLTRKYPGLKVAFAESGGAVNKDGQSAAVKIPPSDILFVAFGHIKQEKWIVSNLNKIPVKLAMGVGGAFDYLSGHTTRPPKIIRKWGLEWLFRLIREPWRVKRQLALVRYLWLLILRLVLRSSTLRGEPSA